MFLQVDNADELMIIFTRNHLNRLILHVQVGHFLWDFAALGMRAHNLLPSSFLLGGRVTQRWLAELRMHRAWLVHLGVPVLDVVAILTRHAWKLHILGREMTPQLIAALLLAPVLRAQNSLDVLDFYILRDLLWNGLLVLVVVVDIQCWAGQWVDKAGRCTLLARVLNQNATRLLRGCRFLF